jgi:hypothetical protein
VQLLNRFQVDAGKAPDYRGSWEYSLTPLLPIRFYRGIRMIDVPDCVDNLSIISGTESGTWSGDGRNGRRGPWGSPTLLLPGKTPRLTSKQETLLVYRPTSAPGNSQWVLPLAIAGDKPLGVTALRPLHGVDVPAKSERYSLGLARPETRYSSVKSSAKGEK